MCKGGGRWGALSTFRSLASASHIEGNLAEFEIIRPSCRVVGTLYDGSIMIKQRTVSLIGAGGR